MYTKKSNLKIKKSFLLTWCIGFFMAKQEKRKVLSPRAIALWLIDNTSLTFKQIADFCDLTEIEVKMMADGVLGKTLCPVNPIETGDLTQEEIHNREQDGKELCNTFSFGIEVNIQETLKQTQKITIQLILFSGRRHTDKTNGKKSKKERREDET